jgi:phosphatidate phosphatase LPIN
MACLRDIKNLFAPNKTPFYAGFGNRLTDALSYRSVSIPSNRIFTINSYAEVSLDLLSLNKLRYSYVNMREVVDHYFPPVNTLVTGGGEEYTDFTYWRDPVLELEDFSDSDSDEEELEEDDNRESEDEEDGNEALGGSYISRDSLDENEEYNGLEDSILSRSTNEDPMTGSMMDEEVAFEEEATSDTAAGIEDGTQTSDLKSHRTTSSEEGNRDVDGEIVTGLKGLSIERERSNIKVN